MNDRDLNIVENAFKLFAHYGVSKTSMTEIAAAAKVARQTLYKAFESKEDLIYAALLHYGGRTRADIERDCARTTDLGERLDVLFEHMGVIPFEAMQRLPHLDEVLEIGDSLEPERRAEIRANYVGAIKTVLAPYEEPLKHAGVAPQHLHNLIKSLFTQIKRDVADVDGLRELFGPMKSMIIAAVKSRKISKFG